MFAGLMAGVRANWGNRFEWFERSPLPVWAWIVLVWALFIFPAISLRSFHYEEGYVVGIARSAIEDKIWLDPHLYGLRFNERPHLMGWTVGVLGMIFGGVNHYVARAPAVLSQLGACLLVFWFVRRHASALAGLFAALCFIVSPEMLQKTVTAEPDIMLSLILFAAFVVWWEGDAVHGGRPLRWLAVGALLALAGLVKGPQPVAFFGLGAGAFYLLRRQWLGMIGLFVAGVISAIVVGAWYYKVYQPGDFDIFLHHSKLSASIPIGERIVDAVYLLVTMLVEMLPGLILLAPFTLVLLRNRWSETYDLPIALWLYGVCAIAVLVVWPHANGRYAMPGMLALAALAGLAFERYRSERQNVVQAAIIVGSVLLVYRVALSWVVMPAMPEAFRTSRNVAFGIAAIVDAQPKKFYVAAETLNKNIVAYLREPFRVVQFDALREVAPPAWVLAAPEVTRQLQQERPDLDIVVRASFSENGIQQLLELRNK